MRGGLTGPELLRNFKYLPKSSDPLILKDAVAQLCKCIVGIMSLCGGAVLYCDTKLGESWRYRSYFLFLFSFCLKRVSTLWIHPTQVSQYSLSICVNSSTRIKGI